MHPFLRDEGFDLLCGTPCRIERTDDASDATARDRLEGEAHPLDLFERADMSKATHAPAAQYESHAFHTYNYRAAMRQKKEVEAELRPLWAAWNPIFAVSAAEDALHIREPLAILKRRRL